MSVCNRCGKENQDHYKFCLGCGAELTVPTAKPGGDMGMMKTMMADPASSPLAGAPLQQPPRGMSPGGRTTGQPGGMGGGGVPGMPPPGPLGGPLPPPSMPAPMGPPPGVPGFSPGFAPPAAAGMRRCPSCGNDVPPSFRFCGTCGFRMDEASAPNLMPSAPTAPNAMGGMGAPQPQRARLSMTLIRPDGSEGGTHDLRPGENKLGRSFGVVFENDGYLSPVHAMLDIRGQQAMVRDLDSLNGVFVKMTGEEELTSGQIIRIGQELIRYELIGTPEPTPDGTELMGSPNPGFWGKLTIIIGREVTGAAYPMLGESITLGRERGEINFPDDGYVSGLHARVSLRDGRVFLADLGSSNGTFVKVNGERAVGHDSFVLLGQQLFRLNLAG
ncbi:MAG: FHA domain-containing protein [Proteobacteria bacterium]|nr:FHA domain-containing protein [Pseudomonadota bacterium]